MKKWILLILAVLLVLSGCTKTEQPASMTQPIAFYYRTAQTDFSSSDGVIRAEIQDLGTGSYTDYEVFAQYFNGPVSKDLLAPFSQDIELAAVQRKGSRLDLHLIQKSNSMSEFDFTLLKACLVKTGLALDGINKVRITVNSQGGSDEGDEVYLGNSFQLFDDDAALNTTEITLYFADEEGRFLLPEKRTVSQMSDEEMASYLLKLLVSEPQSGGMRSPLPPGTAVMEDVSLKNGVCTVVFYPNFCENAPEDEQAQTLAVLSVVNTLCELKSVNQVQIIVPGWSLGPAEEDGFKYLDLSYPWTSDSSLVGPVREELSEFVGVLCLPGQLDNYLHRLTVRARAKGGLSREEALLQMLAARTAQNGLSAPFSDHPSILSVSTKDTVCTVELGPDSLPSEERAHTLAIRSITATLASLPEVETIVILEDGNPVSEEPITPSDAWFR